MVKENVRLSTKKSTNPLDATMTKAQVVRRKFKSSLPRKVENRRLSAMEALARTFDLFDRLRDMMAEAGLKKGDVKAGLVYCQPETKGREHVLVESIELPKPEEIPTFAEKVLALDKPLFLGVIFAQSDREADKADQRAVAFVWPFMAGPEAEGRLLAARRLLVTGSN
jgi:hypothetical protein